MPPLNARLQNVRVSLVRLARHPQMVAAASVAVDALMVVAKLTVGLLSGSLGLVGEAAHSTLDMASSLFALLAVRAARRPADLEHPYGHGRAENLAAYTEGVLLALTATGIAYEAIRRLAGGVHVVDATSLAIAVPAVAILVESGRAFILRAVGRASGSAALEANAQNRLADIFSSAGVLIGLVGVRLGLQWADSVAALMVAAIIAVSAVRLLRQSGDILIDRSSGDIERELSETIGRVEGVREVRGVRVRRSGPQLIGDATVWARRTLSVEGAEQLSAEVREAVADGHPNLELTLVVEGDRHSGSLVERVHAAVARQGAVRDLHNVTVEREEDGTLHLTMHAKLPGDLTLAEGSRVSGELDRALRAELPEVSRIDVHLEPLEADWVSGENVTARRPELAGRLRTLVESHPDVLRCRDVELSDRGGRVYAHVVAELAADTTLDHAHAVETELEERVRAGADGLEDVVARATA
jgi:cation diffusion facilitator family transporter